MANDYLFTLADEIRAVASEVLEAAGIAVPKRTFVTFGEVADDCDLMAVAFQGMYTGNPGFPDPRAEGSGFVTRSASFEIRRVRCVYSADERGKPPSATQMDEDAEEVLTDLWVLHQGLVARKHAKTFLTSCQNFTIGNILPVGPVGGMGGGIIPIEVELSY